MKLLSAFSASNENKPSQVMAGAHTKITFASAQKGSELITNNDDYLSRLSPFDRKSKTQSGKEVSQDELVRFMGTHTREWPEAEKQKVLKGINLFKELSASLHLPLPEEVFFVKTTGQEEGGGAYTRENAIFLPSQMIALPQNKLNEIIFHEFFHVLSRANPALKEKLYQVIGFKNSGEVELPPALAEKKIANPDAPIYDHVIELRVNGKDHWGVPVIYSPKDFDPAAGKTFFDYLTFKLLLVEKNGIPADGIKAAFNNGKARLYSPYEVSGFFEQVGRNTDYMIHPEEILAENFVHMLVQRKNLPDPEIPAKMRNIISNYSARPTYKNKINNSPSH